MDAPLLQGDQPRDRSERRAGWISCDKEIQREAQFDGNSSEKGNYYRQHVSLNCILQSHRMPSMEKSCNLIAILSWDWLLRTTSKDLVTFSRMKRFFRFYPSKSFCTEPPGVFRMCRSYLKWWKPNFFTGVDWIRCKSKKMLEKNIVIRTSIWFRHREQSQHECILPPQRSPEKPAPVSMRVTFFWLLTASPSDQPEMIHA